MLETEGHLVLRFRRWAVIEVMHGDYIREVIADVNDLEEIDRSTYRLDKGAEIQALLPVTLLPETRPFNVVHLSPEFLKQLSQHPNIDD